MKEIPNPPKDPVAEAMKLQLPVKSPDESGVDPEHDNPPSGYPPVQPVGSEELCGSRSDSGRVSPYFD